MHLNRIAARDSEAFDNISEISRVSNTRRHRLRFQNFINGNVCGRKKEYERQKGSGDERGEGGGA